MAVIPTNQSSAFSICRPKWLRLLEGRQVRNWGLGLVSALLLVVVLLFAGAGPSWSEEYPSSVGGNNSDSELVADPGEPGGPISEGTVVEGTETSSADGSAGVGTTAVSAQSGRGMIVFFLVVMLCLFGYYLFTNYGINARIDRLEELLRRHGLANRYRDELVPFSWNAVLRSLEGGLPVLPDLLLPRSGVVMLGVGNQSLKTSSGHQNQLSQLVIANIAHSVLDSPELMVLTITRGLGGDELGRMLLSMQAGNDWRDLDDVKRQALLNEHSSDLERFEKSLFYLSDLVITMPQLFNSCQELLKDGELGAVIIDNLDVFIGDEPMTSAEILEQLAILASRCHVPIILVVSENSPEFKAFKDNPGFLAVGHIRANNETIQSSFDKFPGQSPANQWLLGAGGILTSSSLTTAEQASAPGPVPDEQPDGADAHGQGA